MKPLPELRNMAIKKALANNKRYCWAYDRDAQHFEIIDARNNEVIATSVGAELRDVIIAHISDMEYSPATWSRNA